MRLRIAFLGVLMAAAVASTASAQRIRQQQPQQSPMDQVTWKYGGGQVGMIHPDFGEHWLGHLMFACPIRGIIEVSFSTTRGAMEEQPALTLRVDGAAVSRRGVRRYDDLTESDVVSMQLTTTDPVLNLLPRARSVTVDLSGKPQRVPPLTGLAPAIQQLLTDCAAGPTSVAAPAISEPVSRRAIEAAIAEYIRRDRGNMRDLLIATGALDGDTKEDAVVFYKKEGSGGSVQQKVIVLQNSEKGLAIKGVEVMPDGAPANIRFTSGAVIFDLPAPKPGDAACCPTGLTQYQVNVFPNGVRVSEVRRP